MPSVAPGLGFALAISLVLISACGGGSEESPFPLPPPVSPAFEPDGLDGSVVRHIYRHDGRLFAATHDGLYGKSVGADMWIGLGLEGLQIQGLAIIDDQHWLAATFPSNQPFVDPRLYETVNGGANWLQVANDFGPGATQSEAMLALLYDHAGQQLFATGFNALAMSDDFGRSWLLLDGEWDQASTLEALDLNPLARQVWIGGQNSIEEMALRRYDLASSETAMFTRLLPSPSSIKGTTFDPTDPDRILVAGEGGVLQSFDNGASWNNLLGDVDHRFYFRALLDPQDTNVIYTAGWDKEFDIPQPLILEISRNRGVSWEQHQLDDPNLFGGVWSMLGTRENGRTVLYLGLYRGGIIRVRL